MPSPQRWDHRGRLIRLRDRCWYLDRPREVPLRFVRRWRESYDRHGALTLEDYLEMATGLTDVQLQHAGDLPNFGALPRDLYMIRDVYTGRSALRLYASLTPAPQNRVTVPAALRSASHAALSSVRVTGSGIRRSRHWARKTDSSPRSRW